MPCCMRPVHHINFGIEVDRVMCILQIVGFRRKSEFTEIKATFRPFVRREYWVYDKCIGCRYVDLDLIFKFALGQMKVHHGRENSQPRFLQNIIQNETVPRSLFRQEGAVVWPKIIRIPNSYSIFTIKSDRQSDSQSDSIPIPIWDPIKSNWIECESLI